MFPELMTVADEWERRDLKTYPKIYPRITQVQPRLLHAASYPAAASASAVSKPLLGGAGDNPLCMGAVRQEGDCGQNIFLICSSWSSFLVLHVSSSSSDCAWGAGRCVLLPGSVPGVEPPVQCAWQTAGRSRTSKSPASDLVTDVSTEPAVSDESLRHQQVT